MNSGRLAVKAQTQARPPIRGDDEVALHRVAKPISIQLGGNYGGKFTGPSSENASLKNGLQFFVPSKCPNIIWKTNCAVNESSFDIAPSRVRGPPKPLQPTPFPPINGWEIGGLRVRKRKRNRKDCRSWSLNHLHPLTKGSRVTKPL